jgi:hypothetical protein
MSLEGRPMSFDTSLLKQGLSFVGRNVLALGIAWLTGLVMVQLGARVGDGWIAPWTGFVLGCAAGVGIAYTLKAWPTAVFFLAMVVWGASRFVIQPVFGENAVRGAEVHVLGMGLSVALVTVLALVFHFRGTRNTAQA